MHLPHILLPPVVLLFLIHATNSETKAERANRLWRTQLSDIANLHMINDTSGILNLKANAQRYGKDGLFLLNAFEIF